jgi:hypothetical protein
MSMSMSMPRSKLDIFHVISAIPFQFYDFISCSNLVCILPLDIFAIPQTISEADLEKVE